MVSGDGQGRYPRNSMILGNMLIIGAALPTSHTWCVHSFISRCEATSF